VQFEWSVPVVRDRVVQTALRNVMEPIFERDFAAQSYGFRPGRGAKEALRRVEELLKGANHWVVDADIKGYFDSIPHHKLMEKVAIKISDGRVLKLIESYLKAGVFEVCKGWEATEEGTPQGGVISPLLANIYLDDLDWQIAKAGLQMVRYADDFVILSRTEQEAQRALTLVNDWMQQAELKLHPQKTKIVDATQRGGFEFLGYHFERGQKWPRKKSLTKFKDTVRAKTRRTAGRSLAVVIGSLNPTLRGWFEYFKHSRRWTFRALDGWIRRRLRSLLRKQQKRRGMAGVRGEDQRRWPNAFFADHGLFGLQRAYETVRQSSRR